MGTLKMGTGLKIRRGEQEGRELMLGDIIKGNQTHDVVVKLTGNKNGDLVGKFVGKILTAKTDYGKELEQDLEEFLNAWSNVKVIGNINVID